MRQLSEQAPKIVAPQHARQDCPQQLCPSPRNMGMPFLHAWRQQDAVRMHAVCAQHYASWVA